LVEKRVERTAESVLIKLYFVAVSFWKVEDRSRHHMTQGIANKFRVLPAIETKAHLFEVAGIRAVRQLESPGPFSFQRAVNLISPARCSFLSIPCRHAILPRVCQTKTSVESTSLASAALRSTSLPSLCHISHHCKSFVWHSYESPAIRENTNTLSLHLPLIQTSRL